MEMILDEELPRSRLAVLLRHFFCNGPGRCQGSSLHSRVIRSAGVVLLFGVGARPNAVQLEV